MLFSGREATEPPVIGRWLTNPLMPQIPGGSANGESTDRDSAVQILPGVAHTRCDDAGRWKQDGTLSATIGIGMTLVLNQSRRTTV